MGLFSFFKTLDPRGCHDLAKTFANPKFEMTGENRPDEQRKFSWDTGCVQVLGAYGPDRIALEKSSPGALWRALSVIRLRCRRVSSGTLRSRMPAPYRYSGR